MTNVGAGDSVFTGFELNGGCASLFRDSLNFVQQTMLRAGQLGKSGPCETESMSERLTATVVLSHGGGFGWSAACVSGMQIGRSHESHTANRHDGR
jgi:hypothetical protein